LSNNKVPSQFDLDAEVNNAKATGERHAAVSQHRPPKPTSWIYPSLSGLLQRHCPCLQREPDRPWRFAQLRAIHLAEDLAQMDLHVNVDEAVWAK
jgi:hypothetical protein